MFGQWKIHAQSEWMISSGTIIVAGMKFRLLNLIRPFIRRNSTEFVLYPVAVLKILFFTLNYFTEQKKISRRHHKINLNL